MLSRSEVLSIERRIRKHGWKALNAMEVTTVDEGVRKLAKICNDNELTDLLRSFGVTEIKSKKLEHSHGSAIMNIRTKKGWITLSLGRENEWTSIFSHELAHIYLFTLGCCGGDDKEELFAEKFEKRWPRSKSSTAKVKSLLQVVESEGRLVL